MSKSAAFASLGVALFPCGCDVHRDSTTNLIHFGSAAIMFSVLAGLCVVFYCHARDKQRVEGTRRQWIYASCAVVIVGSMLLLVGHVKFGWFSHVTWKPVYWFETSSLWAFGVAWVVASKTIPFLAGKDERPSLKPLTLR